ncbi:BA75_01615T0 [Komagataella pastoris]|uniref:Protein RER1 n=1 Tax=Komagataella pastoris TaxID=4922 RepID=A0A1B2J648_PICPA|nr:BA75_01615T0 [Komagataella pastoris]
MDNITDRLPSIWGEKYVRSRASYQKLLDQSTPHLYARWALCYVLVFVFLLRIFFSEGWYVVCYTHAIYMLSLFLQFLSPKFDPSLEQQQQDEMVEDGLQGVDIEDNDEFRPFIRRLPEFKFWIKATQASLLALICSFIPLLDIPVFWPILLMYFVVLFSLTMKRQIQHMIKYHYIPFDLGKAKYNKGAK